MLVTIGCSFASCAIMQQKAVTKSQSKRGMESVKKRERFQNKCKRFTSVILGNVANCKAGEIYQILQFRI